MTNRATISVRVSKAAKARLARLAASTRRSQSSLAAEAIEAFLDLREWQAADIERAIAEADAGGPFIAHEDISAWVDSLGTENELPPPRAMIRLN